MTPDRNTLHLDQEDEAVAEYFASKSAGDTVEFRVTGQVRDLNDGGATVDIISAEPTDYDAEAVPLPTEEDESGMIGEFM